MMLNPRADIVKIHLPSFQSTGFTVKKVTISVSLGFIKIIVIKCVGRKRVIVKKNGK